MKILITGITGFVGRRLGPFLSDTDEIAVICRHSSPVCLPNKFRIIEGNLRDPSSWSDSLKAFRPDICVHLAWEGIPDFGFEMSRDNLEQGTALFRFLVQECGCKKIIAMGSCLEYGQSFGACREEVSAPVYSFFAWAKRSLCDFGMMLAQKNDVTFIWLRSFYIYGPGQKGVSLFPTITRALLKSETLKIRTPWDANDFIYVDDVAEAIVLTIRKEIPSGVYNLGSGMATHVWRVCEELEKALGRTPEQAAILKASNVKQAANFWADTSKIQTFLGWRAKISIEAGIRQYLKTREAEG